MVKAVGDILIMRELYVPGKIKSNTRTKPILSF